MKKQFFIAILLFIGVTSFSQEIKTKKEGSITFQYTEDEYGRMIKNGTYTDTKDKTYTSMVGTQVHLFYSEKGVFKNNVGNGPFSYICKETGSAYHPIDVSISGNFKEGLFDANWSIIFNIYDGDKLLKKVTEKYSFNSGKLTKFSGFLGEKKVDLTFSDTLVSGTYDKYTVKNNVAIYTETEKNTIIQKLVQTQGTKEYYDNIIESGYILYTKSGEPDFFNSFIIALNQTFDFYDGGEDLFENMMSKYLNKGNEGSKFFQFYFLKEINYATFEQVETTIKKYGLDKDSFSDDAYYFYDRFSVTKEIDYNKDLFASKKVFEGIKKMYDLDRKAAEYEKKLKEEEDRLKKSISDRYNSFMNDYSNLEKQLINSCQEYKILTDSASYSYNRDYDIVSIFIPCIIYGYPEKEQVWKYISTIAIASDHSQKISFTRKERLPKEEKIYVEKLRKKERMEKDSIHILNSLYALENYLQKEFQQYGKTIDSKAQDITPLGGYKIYTESAVITKTDVSVEISCQILKKEGKNVQIWNIPFILTTDNDRIFLTYDLNKATRIENKELEKELSQKIKKEPLINPLD